MNKKTKIQNPADLIFLTSKELSITIPCAKKSTKPSTLKFWDV